MRSLPTLLWTTLALTAMAPLAVVESAPSCPSQTTISAACNGAKRAGLGNCFICVSEKFPQCTGTESTQFCVSEVPSPPLPPPPGPQSEQGPSEILTYGFTVAPAEPYFIKPTTRLFHINPDHDINVLSRNTADGKIIYSDSDHTAAEQLAANAGISGGVGPFDGAASMAIGSSTTSEIKTARLDVFHRIKKARVTTNGVFHVSPRDKLDPAYAQFIQNLDRQDIHRIPEELGIFFAKSANLGAVIQKSYTMEVTKSDTQSSLEAELKASYGSSFLGGKVSIHGDISERSSDSAAGAKIESSFHIEGGDTELWLGLSSIPTDESDFQRLQTKWADSVARGNLYAFDVELRPIWELVSQIDAFKGELLQAFLEAQWDVDTSKFNPTKFFTPPCQPPSCWPEIYRFTGTVQDTGYHEHILGDFMKTKVTSNGAYVYVNRKSDRGKQTFLYLYRDRETGELIWVFALTLHDKPEDVTNPYICGDQNNKICPYVYFDSSPSAKGACALNGPAAPACKWRECGKKPYARGGNDYYYRCYPYPKSTDDYKGEYTTWYGASSSLKVVVGGTGGH